MVLTVLDSTGQYGSVLTVLYLQSARQTGRMTSAFHATASTGWDSFGLRGPRGPVRELQSATGVLARTGLVHRPSMCCSSVAATPRWPISPRQSWRHLPRAIFSDIGASFSRHPSIRVRWTQSSQELMERGYCGIAALGHCEDGSQDGQMLEDGMVHGTVW